MRTMIESMRQQSGIGISPPTEPGKLRSQDISSCLLDYLLTYLLTYLLKVGFHYPSSRPEFRGRVDGPRTRVHFLTPVISGRELG